jgi:uncharacterized repeat protein (TIGR02543 family)
LTVDHEGSGFILRDNEPPYYYGEIVHLTASPSSGWSFGGWSGDLSGNTNPATITIDGNKSIIGTFTEDWYTLEVIIDPVGSGHVDVDPPGPYRYHAMPILTAYPNPGWTFVNWTGERVGTANPIEVTVNNDSVEYAHFAPIPYTFTTSVIGQGTVSKSPDQATYYYGDQVTVTATSASGWSFTEWSGSCTGTGPCVVTVGGNESVTATFEEGANTLNVSVTGNGTVTRSPDLVTYPNGASVTLTANSAEGWHLDHWEGHLSGSVSPISITMDGDKAVTAVFVPATDAGYTFTGWTGDLSGNTNPTTITLNGDKTVSAIFTQDVYTLTITQSTGGTITADSGWSLSLRGRGELEALADAGYTFTGWTGDLSGNANPTTITMNGDKTVSATVSVPPVQSA